MLGIYGDFPYGPFSHICRAFSIANFLVREKTDLSCSILDPGTFTRCHVSCEFAQMCEGVTQSHCNCVESTPNPRVGRLSPGCNKTLGKSHYQEKGLACLTVWGSLSDRTLGQLVTLCPPSGSRRGECGWSIHSLPFTRSVIPAHRMGLCEARVCLPTSVSLTGKSLGNKPKSCLFGDSSSVKLSVSVHHHIILQLSLLGLSTVPFPKLLEINDLLSAHIFTFLECRGIGVPQLAIVSNQLLPHMSAQLGASRVFWGLDVSFLCSAEQHSRLNRLGFVHFPDKGHLNFIAFGPILDQSPMHLYSSYWCGCEILTPLGAWQVIAALYDGDAFGFVRNQSTAL